MFLTPIFERAATNTPVFVREACYTEHHRMKKKEKTASTTTSMKISNITSFFIVFKIAP